MLGFMRDPRFRRVVAAAMERYPKLTSHGFSHALRVLGNAMAIAEREGGDKLVLALAAVLHDVSYGREVDERLDHGEEGAREAYRLLLEAGYSRELAERVADVIREHRFSSRAKPSSLESAILQDADRLDAIGAIGIARVFAKAGEDSREIHALGEEPGEYTRGRKTSAVTHFHEKLLKIAGSMNTRAAREAGERRHRFMLQFLRELEADLRESRYLQLASELCQPLASGLATT